MTDDLLTEVDLLITEDGDFLRTADGDLGTVTDVELLAQIVRNRLENVNPDWFYDHVCADLEDLLGLPNEPETAQKGEQMIQNTLVDIIDAGDLLVQSVPVNKVSVVFFVFINTGSPTPLGFEVKLALGSHVAIRRLT